MTAPPLPGSRPDPARIAQDIDALAAITDPHRPYTRRSFSPLFLEGRAWLRRRFTESGLECRIDAAGNLFGRHEGQEALPTILLGSHSDTVPDGGRFDGVAGVIAALEAWRCLQEAGVALRHPIEIVDFLAEEPSEFGLSCIGSRGVAGRLTPEHLGLTAPTGETLAAAIDRMGGDAANLASARRTDLAAFLELHIEQGTILESGGLAIGVVQAIAGITRVELLFTGRADHAGTTPMSQRRDAMVAAAGVILFVSRHAGALAESGQGHVTATVGVVETSPNASNIVPRAARIAVDLRVSNRSVAEQFMTDLRAAAEAEAKAARVTLSRFTLLSDTHPVACDRGLRGLLSRAATALGLPQTELVSGAGHDAAIIASVAPSAMIFIPCRDGRSHDPAEWADATAIAAGASVLLGAVLACDAERGAPPDPA